MGDTPLVMNHTRGALCGGKCGDRGRGGFDDEGAVLVMAVKGTRGHASRPTMSYMPYLYPDRCLFVSH